MSTESPNGKNLNLIPKRIVICGGGVIGASTAYFLSSMSSPSSPPLHVTLIEKSSVACAASGKAGGFLALDWCDGGPLSSLARTSFHLHRSLAEKLHGSESYGYRPLETLSLSINKSSSGAGSSSSTTKTGARKGLVPPWIDGLAENVQKIGSFETTAQVHPQLFTRRMVSAAVANGNVEVVIGEVVDVMMDGDRAVGVSLRKKDKGENEMKVISLDADVVVLALGPWSSRNRLVSSVFALSACKAHSIVLRPSEPEAITPQALFLSYTCSRSSRTLDPEVYPRPSGEVYLCGMSKNDEVPDNPDEIVGEPESIAMLHEIAGTVSTHLKTAEILAEQACFLPCTDDGLPVIGEIPGASCCYVATGHNCWGILNGPATGKALAELILNGTSITVDLAPFSPARFIKDRWGVQKRHNHCKSL